jgi:hypothetical protein
MAGGANHGKPVWKGNHPVGQIRAAPPLYRFAATALGAGMWFFVRWSPVNGGKNNTNMELLQLFYRMKKDGPALLGWKHPWDH